MSENIAILDTRKSSDSWSRLHTSQVNNVSLKIKQTSF